VRRNSKQERERELADQAKLTRAWRQWRRECLDNLLADSRYGEAARALLAFCKTMTTPSALISFIDAGPWREADTEVRFQILSLLGAVITKRRERMGLAPFDDALPGQPDNVFLILRARLSGDFPAQAGDAPGDPGKVRSMTA
jgi:hypothetical protein